MLEGGGGFFCLCLLLCQQGNGVIKGVNIINIIIIIIVIIISLYPLVYQQEWGDQGGSQYFSRLQP